jgi:hypothetical protein
MTTVDASNNEVWLVEEILDCNENKMIVGINKPSKKGRAIKE